MQTFLPRPGFVASASTLDDRRLGKQRVEALQVLRALVWPDYGWKRHPVVAMWRGFVPALVGYGAAVCLEWRSRGYGDAVLPELLEFGGDRPPGEEWLHRRDLLPPWLGSEELHASHRCALVTKDPVHYRPLFPTTPTGLPYVWPRPVFPRWPLRREDTHPLDVDAAQSLLGGELTGPGYRDAVERVAAGHNVTLPLTDPDDTAPALVAGWCTPGATLWLVPGAPPVPPPPPPRGAETGAVSTTGTTSRSVARVPGPVERAAMRAAWERAPEFRFRRVRPETGPPDPPVDGAGLTVITGPDIEPPGSGEPVLRLITA